MKHPSLETLSEKLGHTFTHRAYLEDAVSHRSYHGQNNERLEFLGDATLNFIIASMLFRQFPSAKEGELSRLRASLVRGETLAELAQEFKLGDYLRLGPGEQKSGGLQRTSILADAMEAVIGAIYMDAGMAACEVCLDRWFSERFHHLKELPELKDAKTRLQEYLQAHKHPLPQYTILDIEGAAHQQVFHIECKIIGLPYQAVGVGSNRRRAEQEAAMKILEKIEHV